MVDCLISGNHGASSCPSSSKSSSTGQREQSDTYYDNVINSEEVLFSNRLEKAQNQNSRFRGGYTCCVPGCYNNNKKNKNLHFYRFPQGNNREKQLLRKKWIHLISRKSFKPGPHHCVCSAHFPGSAKTYDNNIPIIVPRKTHSTVSKPRPTIRARSREFINANSEKSQVDPEKCVEVMHDNGFEESSIHCSPEENGLVVADYEKKIKDLNQRLKELQFELAVSKKRYEDQIKRLENELLNKSFSIERFKNDSHLFKFYTGLEDYKVFKSIFDSFGPAVHNLVYYDSNTNPDKWTSHDHKKRGKKRILTPENELFIVLVRLRCGLLVEDLACRVGMSTSHISRICITWFDFLHTRFRGLPIWPTREVVDKTMPQSFKDTYPQTRVIIDCTELFIEMPSSLRSQSKTYSNYKHHNTAKGLVGISPSGMITFVSDLYSGRTSDKEATKDCGILSLLEENDSIMADKGFDIENILPKNISLNIPPFLRESEHISLEEETETRRIAALRIHVERAIRRIKCFRILKMEFALSMAADLNKIWIICSYLCNFLPPIIADDD